MKILVVYYSRDGHTKIVAQEISKILNTDIYEIKELKSRIGIMGWLSACKDSVLKKITAIENSTVDPTSYDYVIIGTPVWAFNMPSAVRSWLVQHGKSLKKTIFFATMGGHGDQQTFTNIEILCTKKPLLTTAFIDKEINNGTYKQKLDVFIDVMKKSML